MIKITIKGLGKLRANIRKLERNIMMGASVGIKRGLETLKTNATNELNNKTKIGASLARPAESINNNWIIGDPEIRGNVVEGCLGNSSPHAHMVEFGTSPIIRPVSAKALQFWGYGGTEPFYRAYVHGQEPKRYLTTAIQTTRYMIQSDIGNQIKIKMAELVL